MLNNNSFVFHSLIITYSKYNTFVYDHLVLPALNFIISGIPSKHKTSNTSSYHTKSTLCFIQIHLRHTNLTSKPYYLQFMALLIRYNTFVIAGQVQRSSAISEKFLT